MKRMITISFILVCYCITPSLGQSQMFENERNEGSPCYRPLEDGTDDLTKPIKCTPPFKNVVAGSHVEVDPPEMTCGMIPGRPTEYCMQTGGFYRECDKCNAYNQEKAHNASYLTDIHSDNNQTWWQSVTLMDDVHTTEVNLTVHLNKSFDIVFVRLKFHSPRPESFAIYKKNRRTPHLEDDYPNEDWIPWQYYSATCRDTYGFANIVQNLLLLNPAYMNITKVMEDRALCTSEYSDISPLTGGNVAYSTLEGRPSAEYFDITPELQQWVSATDIRISLRRLNTFGDEVFADPKVLKSYYYGITHFVVGGRCQCNGHSNVCIPDSEDGSPMCLCQHGTEGRNCESCLPDHWDRPWRRATTENAWECRVCCQLGSGNRYLEITEGDWDGKTPWYTGSSCDCNGFSTRCRFNEQLYTQTGRGGECMDCQGNRDGPRCERCLPYHFISPELDAQGRQPCQSCDCDPNGSIDLQCSETGKCLCKPGVIGDKCDMCQANHWSFPTAADPGCKPCNCLVEGSLNNQPECDVVTGKCLCKENVEGQRCDKCKPGHFQISAENEFGCTPCFCYGHTAQCDKANGFTQKTISNDFSRSDEDWKSVENSVVTPVRFDGFSKLIGVQAQGDAAFFVAPQKYLGDQRAVYNHEIKFKLKIGAQDVNNARITSEDLVITGGAHKSIRISVPITEQNNPMPSYDLQEYTFKIHENSEFGWLPALSTAEFMLVLSNITSIQIKGSYAPAGMGFLDDFKMDSAELRGSGPPAIYIERCECPNGYEGQFCERCQPGYYHYKDGGPFARCVPCTCNSHADYCDTESGKCDCNHNTAGHNCEICAAGFYGNALQGTPDDCKQCPCPMITEETGITRIGSCFEVTGNQDSPICTECPKGRDGTRCELCADGYFGDPNGKDGPVRPCQRCNCNGNVDPNAIGNCDRKTGKCLRCVDDTAGFNCERCKSGFFGSATAVRKRGDPQNCQPCQCYPPGTHLDQDQGLPICDSYTGKCKCKPNVVGYDCDACKDGYYKIKSNQGCDPCNCDPIGSVNATCNVFSGQCSCRPGVTGLRCDMCKPNHYGFSVTGCKPCECDPSGSKDLQCDELTGQCPCLDKVEGRKCDRCMENTKSKENGGNGEKICEPCEDCYDLVQDGANQHRRNLDSLDRLLQQIAENPEPVGDDFEVKLKKLQIRVKTMVADAKISSQNDEGETLKDRLVVLGEKLDQVIELVSVADNQLNVAENSGAEARDNVYRAESVINRAREALKSAKNQMDVKGREALRKAQERAKKFGEGSEKMTKIAADARKLVEQQEEDANEITSIAKQAYDMSDSAHQIALNAMKEQLSNANNIDTLKYKLTDVDDKLSTVEKLASNTLAKAENAYYEALTIHRQVLNLEVPSINSDSLEKQANKIKEDARRIKEDAERFMDEYQSVIRDTMNKRVNLQDLLDRANIQQQEVDNQLNEIENHKTKALEAVQIGNNVLKDAQETLETLKDFENRVNSNKDAAEDALMRIQDISQTIDIAREKTEQAGKQLDDAENNSELALNIAKTSKDIAERASQKANEIVSSSTETSSAASKLKSDAENLKDKLDETYEVIKQKNSSATLDSSLATEALKEANQAQTQAQVASTKVAQAKKELEEIKAILQTVEEPEPGLLAELETRVKLAEEKFSEADLDTKLEELEQAKQRQIDQLTEVKNERSILTEEVETIERIISSELLSNFCPQAYNSCLEDKC